jgi:hypothetical protein
MGRSVSYPRGSIVCFEDISSFGYIKTCPECNCQCYEDKCDECDFDLSQVEATYDEYYAIDEFETYIDNLRYSITEKYSSMNQCDAWISREDRAIMENRFSYIGISEYSGLLSIWMVPKEDVTGAKIYVSMRANGFFKSFGTLKKIGIFSNGESVFEKK